MLLIGYFRSGELTVYQSLYYAAELRLSEKLSAEVKKERVVKIMAMLGLDAVKDTIVGEYCDTYLCLCLIWG